MAAPGAGRGSRQRGQGLLTRLVGLLKWRPGRYEVAEEREPAPAQPLVPAQPETEHAHHARYSSQELDACIEHSFEAGEANLYAAALKDSWSGDFDAVRLGMKSRKSKPPNQKAAGKAKAFGGDLYPTSAHTTSGDVRFVKVTTWSEKQKPVDGEASPPAA